MNSNRKALSLEELEAVNGGGFFDALVNAVESVMDSISNGINEVKDIVTDIF